MTLYSHKKVVVALLWLAFVFGSARSFAQGFDFYYPDSTTILSNQVNHGFTFNLYQNCNPAPYNFQPFPVSYTLNGATPVYESIVWNPVLSNGNPFCQTAQGVCTQSGPLNYQQAKVNLVFGTKPNVAAPGLYNFQTKFGVTGFGNFEAANIVGVFNIEPQAFNIVQAGMINRPPKFVYPAVIFTNINQPVSFSSNAVDRDGDSLVYRLRSVGPNLYYASGFTYLNPITANPALTLNSRTGAITFKPTAYDLAGGAGATTNKYIVGLEVDEYRKIGGVATKIGTIQRNILINVISQVNNTPVFNTSQNGTAIAPNSIIDVYPGSQVLLNFNASDADQSDAVSLSSNAQIVLPHASFTSGASANTVSGQLSYTAMSADVRDEPYFITISTKDNACPHTATTSQVIGIRVRNITGLASYNIEPGQYFKAFPNPFTETVSFKYEGKNIAREVQIFNLLGQEIDRIEIIGSEKEFAWQQASKFAAGTYIAKLIGKDKTIQTLKFTKL